jgi:hypothetical protein
MTRSSSVDVLRGFALLGIGIVNLPYLALPMAAALQSPDGAIDLIAKGICQRQSKSEPKGSAKCCHFGVGEIAG